MNKYFFIIPLLLLYMFPSVYASDNITKYIDRINTCDNLTITVTASERIDNNEYSIRDCIGNTTSNVWLCQCSEVGGKTLFDIYIDATTLTYNTYTLDITYYYKEIQETIRRRGGGGGGGGGYYSWNWTTNRTNSTLYNGTYTNTTVPVPELPNVTNIIIPPEPPQVTPQPPQPTPTPVQTPAPVQTTPEEKPAVILKTNEETSGDSRVLMYIGGGILGLVILIILIVIGLAMFTGRNKEEEVVVRKAVLLPPSQDPTNPEFYKNL